MSFFRRLTLPGFFIGFCVVAIAQAPPPSGEVLHVESKLVVLDLTVMDKAGHAIETPLGREDFLIQENRVPQTIYSFESASGHVRRGVAGEEDKSALLIFVLDELNYAYRVGNGSSWNAAEALSERLYERQQLAAFLRSQPAQLAERTEVLALTHHGFHILVNPTRNRDAVLTQVNRHDPGLPSPYRDYLEETGGDLTLTMASFRAIWALALQQRSVAGRKHVVWLGYGGPNSFSTQPVSAKKLTPGEYYAREITDLLVDARVTLDIFGPGTGPNEGGGTTDMVGAVQRQPTSYRFESDFGFSGFVHATGGQWQNTNDVRGEIQTTENYSKLYYTLSYRPTNHAFDGDFRRIRVTVKGHPGWVVLTKAGYYAMPFGGAQDAEHQTVTDLSVATLEAMPFSAIEPTLEQIERVKGTDLVRFTFRLDGGDLNWQAGDGTEKLTADVAVSAAALGPVVTNNVLATQVTTWKLSTPAGEGEGKARSTVSVQVKVPEKTKRLRFAVRDLSNGHIGTLDLDPAAIAAAPEIEETPQPLQPRPAVASTGVAKEGCH